MSRLISITNLVKVFKTDAGDFQALKGVNLQINKGEFVGIIGKSGSGKSTLINMITGIDHPTSGQVEINDTMVHSLSESDMARWRGQNIGVVFQFFQLLPNLTVLENVLLPMDLCEVNHPSLRIKKAMELLKLVDVDEQANKFPSQLSGGQQQRVAIARALANDPPLVVADEPTGNLDSKTSEQIFSLFEELVKKGKTFIMVTHDTNLAKRVNRAIIIADGEVIEEYLSTSFPSLSQSDLVWLSHHTEQKTLRPGEIIIEEGEVGKALYIVLNGEVEVYFNGQNHEEIILSKFGRGQFVGEMELLDGGRSLASVEAGVDGAKVAVIDKTKFQELLSRSPDFKKQLQEIAQKRTTENKLKRRQ